MLTHYCTLVMNFAWLRQLTAGYWANTKFQKIQHIIIVTVYENRCPVFINFIETKWKQQLHDKLVKFNCIYFTA